MLNLRDLSIYVLTFRKAFPLGFPLVLFIHKRTVGFIQLSSNESEDFDSPSSERNSVVSCTEAIVPFRFRFLPSP